jgi:hypothetical protein
MFDMRVAAHGEAHAAFQPAALEHLAAICARHALAEAMHANAPADPGLISTLGHLLAPKKRDNCILIECLILQDTGFSLFSGTWLA